MLKNSFCITNLLFFKTWQESRFAKLYFCHQSIYIMQKFLLCAAKPVLLVVCWHFFAYHAIKITCIYHAANLLLYYNFGIFQFFPKRLSGEICFLPSKYLWDWIFKCITMYFETTYYRTWSAGKISKNKSGCIRFFVLSPQGIAGAPKSPGSTLQSLHS